MKMKLDVLRYLQEHKISMTAAGRAAGIMQQNVRKTIEGNPKASTILAIANGLGIDVRDFFYPDTTEADTPADAPQDGLFAQQEVQTQQQEEGVKAEANAQAQDAREMMYCPHCGTKFFVVNVPKGE